MLGRELELEPEPEVGASAEWAAVGDGTWTKVGGGRAQPVESE